MLSEMVSSDSEVAGLGMVVDLALRNKNTE